MEASTGAGSAESWLCWGLYREPCSAGVPPRTLGPSTRGWHWEPAALELRTLRPAGRNEISRPLSSGIKLGHFLRPSHRGGSHRGSVSTGAPTGSGPARSWFRLGLRLRSGSAGGSSTTRRVAGLRRRLATPESGVAFGLVLPAATPASASRPRHALLCVSGSGALAHGRPAAGNG